VKLESAADFRSLTQPGLAKAGLSFRIDDEGSGYCRVTTETRIVAPMTRAGAGSAFTGR
jgi:hypothetical protein